jgi:hypothetical protein
VAAAGAVSGKVHEAADRTSEKAHGAAELTVAKADEFDVREKVRNSPVPLPLVVAGVVALVGIILIIRGRRR